MFVLFIHLHINILLKGSILVNCLFFLNWSENVLFYFSSSIVYRTFYSNCFMTNVMITLKTSRWLLKHMAFFNSASFDRRNYENLIQKKIYFLLNLIKILDANRKENAVFLLFYYKVLNSLSRRKE